MFFFNSFYPKHLTTMAVAIASLLHASCLRASVRVRWSSAPARSFSLRSSTPSSARRGGSTLLLLLLLSATLLFSQFLGLLHGIAHAGWPPAMERIAEASFNAALFNYVDGGEVTDVADPAEAANQRSDAGKAVGTQSLEHPKHHHHSCVEYDAASSASGIHVHFFSPPLIPGAQVLALWQAFASWDAPLACHFFSRAPPR
ncbi:hypothetical protein PQR63_00230 [Herbaspirillum rhizosphaerae]|uniref:Uncharacterized protein n=1 Tax=Herbaspirillum rhizosphaerae TaxID=346179 RepID=A0ABW8Z0U7_9BURK